MLSDLETHTDNPRRIKYNLELVHVNAVLYFEC